MKTILDTIVDQKRKEIEQLKRDFSYRDFEQSPLFDAPVRSLKQSLQVHSFGIIAEIKRKSPSAGSIRPHLDVVVLGQHYASAGAAGISCLTNTPFFGGSIEDLMTLRAHVELPILQKEFILDEFQLFQAKAAGADAILLISEILDEQHALHLTIMAQSLGLEVLMECHDLKHLQKINDQVDIIGINNRDLHLQKTAIQTSLDLFDHLPKEAIKISESGIRSADELRLLAATGYQGALIGESILKQDDPSQFIRSIQPSKAMLC